jgi:hypothetical protein
VSEPVHANKRDMSNSRWKVSSFGIVE